ncbi:MATE family efflux transporter, partial [Clostridia bacterium OttesenSCG-928-O13]|nr:MATE family efflux transporter [Clostridia bacterium OttesenSCG-928-O13]
MPVSQTLPPRENPLGTEKITTLIRKFSVPAIISMIVNAVYNMVDQIFIGQKIGMLGIAATNVALPLTAVCGAAALLLGVGGASNFNLKLGAGKSDEASYIAGNTLSALAVAGCSIAALVLVFYQPLLQLFGVTNSVLPYAVPYVLITAPGFPFLIFATGACNLIRADGAPNYSMGCMLAGAVFNLIFDPIFLFVFNMGIEGIALATT